MATKKVKMDKVTTIADLIKKKEELIKDIKETKTLHIDRTGLTVEIVEVENSVMMDALALGNDEEYEGNPDEYVVFNVVIEPDLRNKELQDAYECVEPYDIVGKLFNMGEVKGIAEQAMKMAGYDSKVTVVEKVKK